jgi:hypothetical protein
MMDGLDIRESLRRLAADEPLPRLEPLQRSFFDDPRTPAGAAGEETR